MSTSNQNQILKLTVGAETDYKIGKSLEQRITGRFYTHEIIGKALAKEISETINKSEILKIVDPFCGDGRLLCWLLTELSIANKLPTNKIYIEAWDCDADALNIALNSIKKSSENLNIINFTVEGKIVDSFEQALQNIESFDVCITNPPWEAIKPDSRELTGLDEKSKIEYVELLKIKVNWLEENYPNSKPKRKFSGWGANLARCGIEASINIVKKGGLFGIVAPGTIFGDQISSPIRSWLFANNTIKTINHYPASARLFKDVDQAAIHFSGKKESTSSQVNTTLKVIQHFNSTKNEYQSEIELSMKSLKDSEYAIGFSIDAEIAAAINYLSDLPKLSDFENGANSLYRLGRELDETGIANKLSKEGEIQFLKGRQISRYAMVDCEKTYLKKEVAYPTSIQLHRLIWRDVARQTSSRRVISTIIPPGIITGNSINVLTPKTNNVEILYALLGILNSIIFEAQVRATISTNHLSVGSMRKIKIPNILNINAANKVSKLVKQQLFQPSVQIAAQIEIEVSRWYNLPDVILSNLLTRLEKQSPTEIFEIKKILGSNT